MFAWWRARVIISSRSRRFCWDRDLREKKPLEARDLLADLTRDYPTPLFRKELAKVTASIGAREISRTISAKTR